MKSSSSTKSLKNGGQKRSCKHRHLYNPFAYARVSVCPLCVQDYCPRTDPNCNFCRDCVKFDNSIFDCITYEDWSYTPAQRSCLN